MRIISNLQMGKLRHIKIKLAEITYLTSGRAETWTQAAWLLNLCFRYDCCVCTIFGIYCLCCNTEVSAPRVSKSISFLELTKGLWELYTQERLMTFRDNWRTVGDSLVYQERERVVGGNHGRIVPCQLGRQVLWSIEIQAGTANVTHI